jgi:cold shock CspA family protein
MRATTRGDYFYGHLTANKQKRGAKAPGPFQRRGIPETGRVVKLFVGQGHGYIRLANDCEVFFHRSDLQAGTSINDITLGDTVMFERLDDTVSGARALCIRPKPRD